MRKVPLQRHQYSQEIYVVIDRATVILHVFSETKYFYWLTEKVALRILVCPDYIKQTRIIFVDGSQSLIGIAQNNDFN